MNPGEPGQRQSAKAHVSLKAISPFGELLFDVSVHGLGERPLHAEYSIVLGQHVLLDEPKAAFASARRGGFQILVDRPFG